MGLTERIKRQAIKQGIAYCGVANLAEARNFILEQGGHEIAQFQTAISLGITLPKALVDQLPRCSDRAVAMNYKHHGYNVINERLDYAASFVSTLIQEAGYQVFPIPASMTIDEGRICGLFSHKLAAHLAGLGWIGKNCLLITPKDGPRVRWVTILSDAPLKVNNNPVREQCAGCHKCIDICPVKAFTGRAFDKDEPREARYDVQKCNAHYRSLEESGKPRVCGMCLYVCPYGR